MVLIVLQELRADRALIHPKWNGNVQNGFDAALLRLPRSVAIPHPQLAPSGFHAYPSSKVHGFRMKTVLEIAHFEVVANDLCPHLQDLDAFPGGSFCMFSKAAGMASGRQP